MTKNSDSGKFKVSRSIRHRITIYITILVAITVGINTYIAVRTESRVLTQKTTHFIEHIAGDVAFGAERAFVSLNWVFVENMISKQAKEEDANLIFIKLVNPDGEVYMASKRDYYGDTIEAEYMVNEPLMLEDYEFADIDKQGFLFVCPVQINNETWRVLVAVSDELIKANIRTLILESVFWGGLVILLGMFISYMLAKSIASPVVSLTKAANIISTQDLRHRVEIKSNDEVGMLAQAFNDMAEKLRLSYEDLEDKVSQRTTELALTVEKLNESNKQLENFVYIASHDLREPLRKISAFGAMLEKSIKEKISEDDAENLSFMIDGARRMSLMIEGLLVYSRVNTKKQPVEDVDLNQIVQQLIDLELSVALEEKNAAVEVPQPLPHVEVDPVQLRQLLQNFIANGIKYQANGTVPHITVTSSVLADGMVRVNVADNGIGIAPENQDSVFAMFKRLHSRSQYEGTGIGLAVCKKIVERHGGKIGVESEVGKGSTFWFTVPVVK